MSKKKGMFFKFFNAIVLLSSIVSGTKYLTCKIDYRSDENFTNDRYTIEFWPDYVPDSRWIVDNDECRFDVKIKFIPFQNERMIDYDARSLGRLPSLDLGYFSNKDLLFLFDKYENCSYDAVWFEPPSRFYGFYGFKMSVYDSFHDYSWTSYAPVPFLRNVDAVFRDPGTQRIVYLSNHWFYAFDMHGGFVKQGRWKYLWSNSLSIPYIDSVLVTRNKSLCRFYDDRVQCTRFDVHTQRLMAKPTDRPRPFSDVFLSDTLPAFPLKGSFWVSEMNRTVFLDSEDMFWIYDENDRFSHTIPFCEFMNFGKFPCCAKNYETNNNNNATTTVPWWSTLLWGFVLFGRE